MGDLSAGIQSEKRYGGVVVYGLGIHRVDETELVGDLRGVRQQLADHAAAFTIGRKAEARACQRERFLIGRHASEALPLAHRLGKLLAIHLG